MLASYPPIASYWGWGCSFRTMEDDEEITSSTGLCSRENRGPAKCYNSLMVVVFLVLFLDSVISLGSFGVIQSQVSKFWKEDLPGVKLNICILFGHYNRTAPDGTVLINMSSIGSCAFVLWGLISVTIVAFVWLVFSFIQIFFGPKVFSLERVLDFVVLFLTCLLSLSLSITITAGITATCSAIQAISCSGSYLRGLNDPSRMLFFYNPVHIAQTSSWVASMILFFLTIWKICAIIIFVKRWKKRRGEVAMTRFHDEDEYKDETSDSISELGNVAELKEKQKPDNPFSDT